MKTTLILAAFFLLGSTGTIIATHPFRLPPTTDLAVMRDITDKHSAQVDTTSIEGEFNLSANAWQGAKFQFLTLSDVSYTDISEAMLPPQNQWLGNEMDRNKQVAAFTKQVSGILAAAALDTTGKEQSSLYLPIANELTRLSASKADKKVILIYSDLMENTAVLSFYNAKTFWQLKQNPNSIVQQFESEQPLPSLNGIEIHLLYSPQTPQQDEGYRTVAAFYKNLFEQYGATVIISANLTN